MVPVNEITQHIWRDNGYPSSLTVAQYEIVFLAKELPPLGFATYFVSRNPSIL